MPTFLIDRMAVSTVGAELRRRNRSILEIDGAAQHLHFGEQRRMALGVVFYL
jgi:hypothetical protein